MSRDRDANDPAGATRQRPHVPKPIARILIVVLAGLFVVVVLTGYEDLAYRTKLVERFHPDGRTDYLLLREKRSRWLPGSPVFQYPITHLEYVDTLMATRTIEKQNSYRDGVMEEILTVERKPVPAR